MWHVVSKNHFFHKKKHHFRSFLLIFCFVLPAGISSADEIRFDFESGSLGGWHIVDGVFGRCVTDRNGDKNGIQGRWFFSSSETETGGADNRGLVTSLFRDPCG